MTLSKKGRFLLTLVDSGSIVKRREDELSMKTILVICFVVVGKSFTIDDELVIN